MAEQKSMFLYVGSGNADTFKENHVGVSSTDPYYSKIAFLEDTKEIVTHGKVFAEKCTSDNDIIVAGGPLADDVLEDVWPASWKDSDGNKILPKNTSLEDLLKGLFLQEKWGSLSDPVYTWSPSLTYQPTANIGASSAQIVGTTLTVSFGTKEGVSNPNASATVSGATYGYSLDGSKQASTNSSYTESASASTIDNSALAATATIKAGNSATATSISNGDSFVVGEGTNTLSVSQSGTTVTAGTFDEATVYNMSNTKTVNKDDSKTINEAGFQASDDYDDDGVRTLAARTNSSSITGYYPYYSGLITEDGVTDAWFTEANVKKNSSQSVASKMTTTATTYGYFVAVPNSSSQASKSKIKIENSLKTSQFGVCNKMSSTVSINVAGSVNKDYYVFYVVNAAAWGKAEEFASFTWS